MKLKKIFVLLLMMFFFILSCPNGTDTTLYNHAQVRIRNSPNNPQGTNIIYKAAVIDEYSESGDTGDKVIKSILPTNNPVRMGSYDTFDINWTNYDSDVFVKVYWGGSDCYDNSTDFFEVCDGEVVTVDLSSDTVTKWRILN